MHRFIYFKSKIIHLNITGFTIDYIFVKKNFKQINIILVNQKDPYFIQILLIIYQSSFTFWLFYIIYPLSSTFSLKSKVIFQRSRGHLIAQTTQRNEIHRNTLSITVIQCN